MKYFLIIMLFGSGSGTGAAIEKIEFRTEESCEQAATKITKHRMEKAYGYAEALCVTIDDRIFK